MSNFDYMDDDEKDQYHSDYMRAMEDFTKNLTEGDRESIFETMENIRYRPTSDAVQDAELNFLRSRKIVAGKKRELGKAAGGKIDSYLKFKAKAEGKSAAEIQQWADKTMKGND